MIQIRRRCRTRLIHALFDQREHTLGRTVQKRLRKFTGFDGFHDLPVSFTYRGRHLQFKTCRKRIQAVVGRAPVTHDHTVKSPLVAENIGQEFSVLTAVFPVDTVISTHDRPRLRFFNYCLER